MSSRMGRALSVQLFGESHGPMVGVTIDGLPAGLAIDEQEMERFLRRRAAGGSPIATGRKETDQPRIVSGFKDGRTTGYPLTAVFENKDVHSKDYDFLPDLPRPGHADYPAYVRSGGYDDLRGSGHHSGRLTLPYAFAGGVALQALSTLGVEIAAHVRQIGAVTDDALDELTPDMDALRAARDRAVPTLNLEAGESMYAAIRAAREEQDSLGGVVEAVAVHVPVGLGGPWFEGMEAVVAGHMFSIPAVKGVEFGAGFHAAALRGSQYNDPYAVSSGRVVTTQNQAGGLIGGITNGMPILVRAAFRPTPSIARPQRTVSLDATKMGESAGRELTVQGRHDPCVVVRAVPVVEGALAIGLLEMWLQRNGDKPFPEVR